MYICIYIYKYIYIYIIYGVIILDRYTSYTPMKNPIYGTKKLTDFWFLDVLFFSQGVCFHISMVEGFPGFDAVDGFTRFQLCNGPPGFNIQHLSPPWNIPKVFKNISD